MQEEEKSGSNNALRNKFKTFFFLSRPRGWRGNGGVHFGDFFLPNESSPWAGFRTHSSFKCRFFFFYVRRATEAPRPTRKQKKKTCKIKKKCTGEKWNESAWRHNTSGGREEPQQCPTEGTRVKKIINGKYGRPPLVCWLLISLKEHMTQQTIFSQKHSRYNDIKD